MLLDVGAGHAGVLERICDSRILLSLYDQPALVVVLVEQLEYGREVYAALRVARYGEHALRNGAEEALVLGVALVHCRLADIFEMDMADAVVVLLENFDRVLTGEGEMTGIVNHADVLRVGHSEHTVDFVGLLHGSRHVMMVHNLHAAVISDLAEVIQTLGQYLPLIVVQHLLVGKRSVPLMLNGERLIRRVDNRSTDRLQKVHVVNKCTLVLPHRQFI